MEDVVLFLYLREEEYGRRLLRFFLNKKNPWLHPELITEKQHLVRRVSLREERLAVLTDDRTVQAFGRKPQAVLHSGRICSRLFCIE